MESHQTAVLNCTNSEPAVRKQKIAVFDHDSFDIFVSRIVRKNVALQFLEPDHVVIQNEERLISEAQEKLSAHLAEKIPAWSMEWRMCKNILTTHIRQLTKERLELHDIDDETRLEALERIFQDDFATLWPKSWLDSLFELDAVISHRKDDGKGIDGDIDSIENDLSPALKFLFDNCPDTNNCSIRLSNDVDECTQRFTACQKIVDDEDSVRTLEVVS